MIEYKTHVLLSAIKSTLEHESMVKGKCTVSYPGFVTNSVDRMIEELLSEGWRVENIFTHRDTIYARCWRGSVSNDSKQRGQ